MKLRKLKELITEAEKQCTGDADECEIIIVANNWEQDIESVETEDDRMLIFAEITEGDEGDDEDQ